MTYPMHFSRIDKLCLSRSAIVLPYHPGKVLIKVSCSVTQGIDDSPAAPSRDEVFPDIFVVLN